MCGIAAIFAYCPEAPLVDEGELISIRDVMTTRGPDGAGLWFDSGRRVGLGHRRLSIIDVSSAGHQPMLLPERRMAITFNGEIYNYRELRADLEKKGCRFRSQCDTEVLLHLYAEEGETMLHKLRGMFAFAIWDGEKRRMFLARDPFGIKPLYYSDDGKTLRAASQIRALLAGGQVDNSPEPAGHVGYFLWGHVPAPYTLYRGIRNLAAGHSLTVESGGRKRLHPFCQIPDLLAAAESDAGKSEAQNWKSEVPAQLRSALSDSVRHHLVSDVPVGIFLSAGLDSTTITALAAEMGGRLHSITVGFNEFKGTADDETGLAESVARHYGTRHQTVWVTRRDFENDFQQLLQAMDQPTNDGVNSYFISKAAAQAGLKVALCGLGGDELTGSYATFHQVPRAVSIFRSFNACRPLGRVFRVVSATVLRRMTSPKYASLLEYGGTYGGAYLLRRGMFMPWELPEFLDGNLVKQGWQELQTLARLEDTVSGIHSPHLKISALEMTWYMRHQLLREADWGGMAHSVEIRVPLVDVDLLRALAPLFAREPRPTKQDLALTPCTALPASVLNRRKTGFQVPVRRWLMQAGHEWKGGELNPAERGLRGWVRLIYAAHVSGRTDSLILTRASFRRPVRPASKPRANREILVFRIGQLGDTVAALPAMWAIRRRFPDARMTLLGDSHPDKNYVFGPDLLRGSGLFQNFEYYPVRSGGEIPFQRWWDMLRLLRKLRLGRYDTLVYLTPSARAPGHVRRDLGFFRLAGIHNFIGERGFDAAPSRQPGVALDTVPQEADMLLARLAASGISTPPPGRGCMDLNLGQPEANEVRHWLNKLSGDGGRPWIAFGPGSKMPAKRWPAERFAEVGRALIARHDIWPVVFGGNEDGEVAGKLLGEWGRGYNAAGHLSVRGAAQALKACVLYIGNDTGTMHLAAAVGVRCVAIFSARDWPGRWYPYGQGHRVLRAQIDCEGCGLVECIERQNECLKAITVEQALAKCETVLEKKAKDGGHRTIPAADNQRF
ncbi:MAG TPA: asparagine synthase (glutamine-hydrolyzing) [Verrucomicrobiae bacterium]|nr:asparagine synthase (glutamine-hydrolyzing) [Verrucomicrobiae bacterium]